jgi:hypothetical protein
MKTGFDKRARRKLVINVQTSQFQASHTHEKHKNILCWNTLQYCTHNTGYKVSGLFSRIFLPCHNKTALG